MFDVSYPSDWTQIGEYRQKQKENNTNQENSACADGDKALLCKDGILHKAESQYESDPWTITSVHTNDTIRVQHGTKSERLNIRRVTPYFE